MVRAKRSPSAQSTAAIGFEAKLWFTAEQAVPAPHSDEADSTDGCPLGHLGLIFLKYISDTFELPSAIVHSFKAAPNWRS